MRSLTCRDAVTAALTDNTLDPSLRALIGLRVWQVDTDRRRPLGEILQIVVIQEPMSEPAAKWRANSVLGGLENRGCEFAATA